MAAAVAPIVPWNDTQLSARAECRLARELHAAGQRTGGMLEKAAQGDPISQEDVNSFSVTNGE